MEKINCIFLSLFIYPCLFTFSLLHFVVSILLISCSKLINWWSLRKLLFPCLFFCLLLSFNFSSSQQQLFSGHQQQQSSIKLLHKSMLNCCHLSSHLKSIWRQFFFNLSELSDFIRFAIVSKRIFLEIPLFNQQRN